MGNKVIFFDMGNTGLTEEELANIREIFSKYPQVEAVLLYGSRAMGNYKPASDIDLALIGKNIDLRLQTIIEFDLDDLMLPYKFDVSVHAQITNPALLEHIKRVGMELYRRKEKTGTLYSTFDDLLWFYCICPVFYPLSFLLSGISMKARIGFKPI